MIILDIGKIVNKREMMSDNNNKQRLYPTRLDIPAESRSGAIAILNQTLAATLDLKTQVKQAHGNVKGMDLGCGQNPSIVDRPSQSPDPPKPPLKRGASGAPPFARGGLGGIGLQLLLTRPMDLLHLHEMFDEMAGELEEYIDMAPSSILPEYPLDILDGKDHVIALAEGFAPYAKHLGEAIGLTDDLGDAETADLYTEISRT